MDMKQFNKFLYALIEDEKIQTAEKLLREFEKIDQTRFNQLLNGNLTELEDIPLEDASIESKFKKLLLDRLQHMKIPKNVNSQTQAFSKLIDKAKDLKIIQQIFQDIINQDIQMDNVLMRQFNVFMIKLMNDSKIEVAHQLFKQLKPKNSFNYTTLIHGYLIIGKYEIVTELYHEMIESQITIQISQFNMYMKQLINQKQIEIAHQLFDKISHVDEVSYSTLIQGYIKLEKWENIERLIREMISKNVKMAAANMSQFNIFMKRMIKNGRIGIAHDLFNGNKFIDEVSYSTLIQGYLDLKQLDIIEEIFEEMIDKGLKMDESNIRQFNIYLHQAVKEERIEFATHLFMNVKNKNSFSYTTLIHGYLQRNDLEMVTKLLEEMVENRIQVQTAQFSVFLRHMIQNNKLEVTYQLAKKIDMSEGNYWILLKAFLNIENWDVVCELLKEMTSKKMKIPHIEFNNFLKKLLEHRRYSMVSEMIQLIAETDFVVEKSMLKYIFRKMVGSGEVDKVREIVKKLESFGKGDKLMDYVEFVINNPKSKR